MENRKFVGVFDSGLGGISVLAELVKVLPCVDFEYFGDSKNAPYGTKEVEFIIHRSREIVQHFVDRGAIAVVIACNTATSAAAEVLRSEYSIPIIGMEPALKPAIELVRESEIKIDSKDDNLKNDKSEICDKDNVEEECSVKKTAKIAVLATPRTLLEEKYRTLVEDQEAEEVAIELPSPELVDLVEHHFDNEDRIRRILKVYCKNRLEKLGTIRKSTDVNNVKWEKPIEAIECQIEVSEEAVHDKRESVDQKAEDQYEFGAIVLGCTHFVFLKKYFEEFYDIPIIDGNRGTAERLKSLLEIDSANSIYRGRVRIENSAGEEQNEKAKELFKAEIYREDYDFVSQSVKTFIQNKLDKEEALFAEKYYIERQSLAEISRDIGMKGKKLKDLQHKVEGGMFKYISRK